MSQYLLYAAHMREVRHTYKVLVGKCEVKGLIGTSRSRWKIGMDV
jgi:hypothetical protein